MGFLNKKVTISVIIMCTPMYYCFNELKYPTQCLGLIQIKMSASANQKVNCFHHVIQSHQNSYFPSAIRTWNNLSAVLISVPTLEVFKVELAHV